ncbi:iron ABC transporter substrate-binding protein [Nostoc piscinale CENA21]|uniref:Iron ABC transporter substrate-binding protein n=1 Tax=Nostoc piscinale CENA21 TaxID=224013 RepID=A0A0M4TZW9_9NOSO|nr:ABC transporter substrate-binding protein [Nostoc piscinale]ALF55539.1 iron ABC transporter substrate-binding protein [Nostoc piscinale CENA21]
MYNRLILSALAILISIFLMACSTATTQQPQPQTPAITASSNNQKIAKRVVSLSSLATDIIYQLDKTKLVGIAGNSLFKNEPGFKDIPRVSEGQTPPSLEKIVALKPDLVIGIEGFSTQVIQKLQELKIPTLLTQLKTWDSLENLTQKLGDLIGANPEPLLTRYKSFLPEKQEQNISTLVLVSNQPILTPNKSSWAGSLLEKFQLKNVAAELQGKSPFGGYVTLSAEKVLDVNPDTIIVINPPQATSNKEILESFSKEAFWQKLKATQNNRVYIFDYYGLVNPGSINAIEKTCQQLKKRFICSNLI